jgi:hypothetical protein
MSLRDLVAGGVARQQAAIATFPLGAGLGTWWYSMYPVFPSVSLMAITTGTETHILLGCSIRKCVAASVSDPLPDAVPFPAIVVNISRRIARYGKEGQSSVSSGVPVIVI